MIAAQYRNQIRAQNQLKSVVLILTINKSEHRINPN